MKKIFLGSLLLLGMAVPARADLPDIVLDRDYQNCIGDDAADKDRAAYCKCVRDGMSHWDPQTYLDAAQQAADASGAGAQPPGKIEELAKQCIAQVLR
jgi:hypothetical protein